ncbi:MAG: hypothetical protein H0U76_30705 [Ktedonobacteraceae bacterium]|nr:hypothetical protein [Ktedonobacteraceae bacterium]
MKNRYYVQPLTDQVFLVRERKSVDGGPGPNDRIVRSFAIRADAYMHVNTLNTSATATPAATTSNVSK